MRKRPRSIWFENRAGMYAMLPWAATNAKLNCSLPNNLCSVVLVQLNLVTPQVMKG